MAKLNVLADLGAPSIVATVDILTEKYQPAWNEWIAYGMTIGPYIAAAMDKGGDFVKNLGVASLPWMARHIATRAGFLGAPITRRAAEAVRLPVRAITRYPGESNPAEMEGARLI